MRLYLLFDYSLPLHSTPIIVKFITISINSKFKTAHGSIRLMLYHTLEVPLTLQQPSKNFCKKKKNSTTKIESYEIYLIHFF